MPGRTYADFGFRGHRLRIYLKPEDWETLEWKASKSATSLAHLVEAVLMVECGKLRQLPEWERRARTALN